MVPEVDVSCSGRALRYAGDAGIVFAPELFACSASFSVWKRLPAAPAGLHPLRALQRHVIGPAVHRAECGRLQRCPRRVRKGQQHRQASQLVRATRCRASVPEV